jgi:UDP-N-acetylmuramyl pentapeptide phosphotransferase/UDP-N-acetylglucosamine-1-phosphate transferase
MNDVSWAAVGLSAFAVALVVAPAGAWLLPRLGLVAVPNERSSHTRPTPIGVGVVVPLAVMAAVLLSGAEMSMVVFVAVAFAAFGFIDDFADLSVGWRLAGQLALALVGTRVIEIPVTLALPVAAGVVAAVNGVNFMDGINGITALHGAIFGATLAVAGASAESSTWVSLGIATSAACIGYLPNNFPNAKSFPGDVLPYFLASTLILGLVDIARYHPVAILGVGALVPMALDTSMTVIHRARRGERLTQAHRSHAYQRLARLTSHVTASLAFSTLSLLTALSLPIALLTTPSIGLVYLLGAGSGVGLALAALPQDA